MDAHGGRIVWSYARVSAREFPIYGEKPTKMRKVRAEEIFTYTRETSEIGYL